MLLYVKGTQRYVPAVHPRVSGCGRQRPCPGTGSAGSGAGPPGWFCRPPVAPPAAPSSAA